jgi:ATP-dependent Clp protease ATP-binding subunit ClpA
MGVLDKAALRLGDNSTVNFERSLIFLTSNLGAREMRDRLRPGFGFEAITGNTSGATLEKLHHIGMVAVRRKFSPEFVNRIDTVITYQPLDADALGEIVDLQIAALELHIENRLGEKAFELAVSAAARQYLLSKGTSSEYGARELKRTVLREVTQPLAAMVANGEVPAESIVSIDCGDSGLSFTVRE